MSKLLSILFTGYFLSLYFSNALAELFTALVFLMGCLLLWKESGTKVSSGFFQTLPKDLLISLGILLVTAFVSYAVNPKYAGFKESVFSFRWILILLMGYFLASKDIHKYLRIFFQITLISLPVVAIICVLQVLTNEDFIRMVFNPKSYQSNSINGRAVGFATILTTSYIAGMAVFFVAPFFLAKEKLKTVKPGIILIALISGLVTILSTQTRGATLTLILVAFLFLFFYFKNRKLWSVKTLFLTYLLGLIILTSSSSFLNRTKELNINNISVSDRIKFALVNLSIAKDNPFFGVGYLNSWYYEPVYREELSHLTTSASNMVESTGSSPTEILAGLGGIGFLAFYYMSFLFLKYSFAVYQCEKDTFLKLAAFGCFLSQLYFHIGGLFEGLFFATQPRHMIVFLWTLSLALYLKATSSEKAIAQKA